MVLYCYIYYLNFMIKLIILLHEWLHAKPNQRRKMQDITKCFITPVLMHDFIFDYPDLRSFSVCYRKEKYHDRVFKESNIEFPEKIKKSVVKRRAEYFAGRFCAHKALIFLGCMDTHVAASTERAPLWPTGVLGSISHTDNFAISAVGSAKKIAFIGIDVEVRQQEIFIDIANEFTSSIEQNYLLSLALPYDISLLIVFSAKESLFKALWPTVKSFLDFSYAEIINIDDSVMTFSFRLTRSLTPYFKKGNVISGRYYFHGEKIITIIAK